MKHIIRIEAAWLRKPLVLLVYPFAFLQLCCVAFLRHPVSLTHYSFYEISWAMFWASWEGYFVPERRS